MDTTKRPREHKDKLFHFITTADSKTLREFADLLKAEKWDSDKAARDIIEMLYSLADSKEKKEKGIGS